MSAINRTPVILMADDDADDRLLANDALLDCAFEGQVRFVEDGEELVCYLRRSGKYNAAEANPRPGLILLDLNMPRKNGKEVLKEIKADPALRQIPVVVFTTSRSDTDIAAVYELGANSFVVKPTGYDDLVGIMRSLKQYWFSIVQLPGLCPTRV
jgi:CheY-like chemotaxis protein